MLLKWYEYIYKFAKIVMFQDIKFIQITNQFIERERKEQITIGIKLWEYVSGSTRIIYERQQGRSGHKTH